MNNQYGGGNCTLCGSVGTNKSTCPLNPKAARVNPAKHPLAAKKAQPIKPAAVPVAPVIPVQPVKPAKPQPVKPVPMTLSLARTYLLEENEKYFPEIAKAFKLHSINVKWLNNHRVNPRSGRSIKPGTKIWNKYRDDVIDELAALAAGKKPQPNPNPNPKPQPVPNPAPQPVPNPPAPKTMSKADAIKNIKNEKYDKFGEIVKTFKSEFSDLILKWLSDPTKSPKTNRPIKLGGTAYENYKQQAIDELEGKQSTKTTKVSKVSKVAGKKPTKPAVVYTTITNPRDFGKYQETEAYKRFMRDSKITKPYDPEIEEFLKWSFQQSFNFSTTYEHKKPANKASSGIKDGSYEIIAYKDLPDEPMSMITGGSYNDEDDAELFKSKTFYKLKSCNANCSNKGIYELTELNDMINKSNVTACVYCQEAFDIDKPAPPPYGLVTVYTQRHKNSHSMFEINFTMDGGTHEGKTYQRTTRTAYIPYSKTYHIECTLGVWLLINAFRHGALFTLGTSVTHGTFGIVFGGIHIKTNNAISSNHGFARSAIVDYLQPKGVFDRLVSECAANGIYTPYMLVEMKGSGAYSDTVDICRNILANIDPDVVSGFLRNDIKKATYCDNVAHLSGLTVSELENKTMRDVADVVDLINQRNSVWLDVVTKAQIIKHKKGQPLTQYIDRKDWNKFGYTQITKFSMGRSSDHPWLRVNHVDTLLEAARYHVKNQPRSVLAFHGTVVDHLDSIWKGLDWTKGGGRLGKGFYITLSPNEAKGYACVRQSASGKAELGRYIVLLELIIERADELTVQRFDGYNTDKNGKFLMQHDNYSAQFAGEQELIDRTKIQNIHVMHYRDTMTTHTSYSYGDEEENNQYCIKTIQELER